MNQHRFVAEAVSGTVGNLCSTASSRVTSREPTAGPAVLVSLFSLLASSHVIPVAQSATAKEMGLWQDI